MRHLKIYEHLIHTFSQEDLDDIIDIFQDIVDEYSLYKIGDLPINSYKILFSNSDSLRLNPEFKEYYYSEINIGINCKELFNNTIYTNSDINNFIKRCNSMGYKATIASRFSTLDNFLMRISIVK